MKGPKFKVAKVNNVGGKLRGAVKMQMGMLLRVTESNLMSLDLDEDYDSFFGIPKKTTWEDTEYAYSGLREAY